jgi:hypothetical protein
MTRHAALQMQEFNMYDSGPVIGAGSRDTFLYGLGGVAKAEHIRSSDLPSEQFFADDSSPGGKKE